MFAAMRPARAAALPPQFDVILCNPPYVRTDDMRQLPAEYQHEPKLALDGGADGMKFVRVLLREAYVCVSVVELSVPILVGLLNACRVHSLHVVF
jgi:methylase of polypeptide subunit release factors